MTHNATDREIASFMLKLYNEENFLLQKVAALEILEKFGEAYVSFNKNRNLAIDKNILGEFKKLTPTAIWDRHLKAWREKENDDPDKSRQTIYK